MSENKHIFKKPSHIDYGAFLDNKDDDLMICDSDDDIVEVETFSLDKIPHAIDMILSPDYSPTFDINKTINHFTDPFEMRTLIVTADQSRHFDKTINHFNKRRNKKIIILIIIIVGLICYLTLIVVCNYLYMLFIDKSY